MIFCLFMSLTCMAQTRKAGTTQRKPATTHRKSTSTSQKAKTSSSASTKVNDGAEISFSGHIDQLRIGKDGQNIEIGKNIKADYLFKVYSDPTDSNSPRRKTVILTCDIDWRTLAKSDEDVPIDWSWSSRNISIEKQQIKGHTTYMVFDGQENVATIFPKAKIKGKETNIVALFPGGNQLTGLRQGMHIDDVARHIQSEIPGTRVVVTGKKVDGLTEYVLLSYGESKVYEVTGDYHYELNNNEPYFTFWTDSNNKLVKWFVLKRVR